MKALTIKQPWASLIVWGVKDIENRDWRTAYTGLVAIHSSARLCADDMQDACDLMRTFVPKFSERRFKQAHFPTGSILGTVEIAACVNSSDSPWFVGQYGFNLRNPVRFGTPIPCRGALGFWTVPEDLLALAREQYRDAKGASA